MRIRCMSLAWVAVSYSALAVAGNDTVVAAPSLYATYNSLGVVSQYSGDDNGNNEAVLEYRVAGASAWRPGLPMALQSLKDGDARTRRTWASSAVLLAEDTDYDVRVTYVDPDGVSGTAAGTVRTRSSVPPAGSGTTYHVATGGSDGGPGTESQPFATIQHAADVVAPGDTVLVHPGLYRETVTITRSGTATEPITFRSSDPSSQAIVDGADAALAENAGGDRWTLLSGAVYTATLPFAPDYVAQGETRLFQYDSLAKLTTDQSGVVPSSGAWHFDAEGGTLHVRLSDGADPDSRSMNVARLEKGFEIGASYVRVSGFEVRFFNAFGIVVAAKMSSNVIDQNAVRNCGGRGSGSGGIFVLKDASENLVQENQVRDTVFGWPWSIHGGPNANSGIRFDWAGTGNVVRSNTVRGTENGIMTYGGSCSEGGVPCTAVARFYAETDIHDNVVLEANDDGIEIEGPAVNKRVWNNLVRDSYVTYAMAPVTFGPAYVFRNIADNFYGAAFKLGESSFGPALVVHNTMYSTNKKPGVTSNNGPANWGGNGLVGNVSFRNNVIQVLRYVFVTGGSNVTADYDLLFDMDPANGDGLLKWDDVRYDSLAELQTASQEPGGKYGDALFVDPASGDFSLQADSPAIDSGVVIAGLNDPDSACPYQGAGPDIGAIELGGSCLPPATGGTAGSGGAGAASGTGGGGGAGGSGGVASGGTNAAAANGSERDGGCSCRVGGVAGKGAGGARALALCLLLAAFRHGSRRRR